MWLHSSGRQGRFSFNGVQILPLTLLVVVIFPVFNCSPLSENVTKIMNDLLKKPYDKRIRPLLGENALFVRVSFLLDSLLDVDELNSAVSVQLTLRQSWLEPRLTFGLGMVPNDIIQLSKEQAKHLWLPDTSIKNQRKLEKIEGQESTFLNSEGLITTYSRFSLTFGCRMSYTNFPFDTQTCTINIMSYANGQLDVIYEWITEESLMRGNEPLRAGRFQLISYDTKTTSVSTTRGSTVSLVLSLHFEGVWQRYLASTFFPLMFLTVISVTSLWFKPQIGFHINLLNIGFLTLTLVGLTRDSALHTQKTSVGQYINYSIFFILASFLIHILKFFIQKHPVPVQIHEGTPETNEPIQASNTPDIENGMEMELKASSLSDREEPEAESEVPLALRIVAIFRQFHSLMTRFSQSAHWILFLGLILFNSLYFAIYTSNQADRVVELLRHIRS